MSCLTPLHPACRRYHPEGARPAGTIRRASDPQVPSGGRQTRRYLGRRASGGEPRGCLTPPDLAAGAPSAGTLRRTAGRRYLPLGSRR